ncbi:MULTISPECIES: Z1 domain-containing protein [Abiotrophia]|uniref:Z1 domain-containing protein n=1 Tax=Abiotrophia TaxID=46123 RepID=UPI0008A555B1|nr:MULTISPECIES: Z1 domain-containing protein [Abiotrophia]OFS29448.1 hypothetical protein HMPREF3093_04085 [Abiotrophia sp. HMSC24B09]
MENYDDFSYSFVIEWIKAKMSEQIEMHHLIDGSFFTNEGMNKAFGLKMLNNIDEKIFDDLVKRIYSSENVQEAQCFTNNKRMDVEISQNEASSWQKYSKGLLKQGWSYETVKQLEESAVSILQNMTLDSQEDGPTKGLVVGNVQSGKTANMAGVMAMAADQGFNIFIVLSGTIESLRQQTSSRLFHDLHVPGGALVWNHIDKPSPRSSNPAYDMSRFSLEDGSRERYMMVCLKNKARLDSLKRWLYADQKKMKQMKILIIDDEADQASINTNDVASDESPTVINRIIKSLVHQDGIKSMNYVAYTATPYANILNEVGEHSLYPKDYIIVLPKSPEYIGPSEIFGTSEPEQNPSVDIVRQISSEDRNDVIRLCSGEEVPFPKSLKEAVNWFIISVAALRSLNYRKPISMLVHTSFKVDDHKIIAEAIEAYMKSLKNNSGSVIKELKIQYENETLDFNKEMFLDGFPDYPHPENIPVYPRWENIKGWVQRILRYDDQEYISHIKIDDNGALSYHKGFHLAIDNSRGNANRHSDEHIRLVYPDKAMSQAPAFIVVGGNTLARGLTIQGLVSTYFLRQSRTADTLMQMARWFGYRKGYEIFPRIWLDTDTHIKYQFLSQMNEELREEIEVLAKNRLKPTDYGVRLKQSPNLSLIRLTASNRMQQAISTEFNFNGFRPQVVYYDNNVEKLKANFRLTEEFLNSLSVPEVTGKYMVWRDVSFVDVAKYLSKYYVVRENNTFDMLSSLVEWCEKNQHKLENWSVVFSSKGQVEPADSNSDWNIYGYDPHSVIRTKHKARSTDKIYSIGTLRSPNDLLADIPNCESIENKKSETVAIRAIRRKHHFDNVPQLLIYRIAKDGVTPNMGDNRESLGLDHDAIGISIWIPGSSENTSTVEYVSPNVSNFSDEEEKNDVKD